MCVTVKSLSPNISHLDILHVCVVHSLRIWCEKAVKLANSSNIHFSFVEAGKLWLTLYGDSAPGCFLRRRGWIICSRVDGGPVTCHDGAAWTASFRLESLNHMTFQLSMGTDEEVGQRWCAPCTSTWAKRCCHGYWAYDPAWVWNENTGKIRGSQSISPVVRAGRIDDKTNTLRTVTEGGNKKKNSGGRRRDRGVYFRLWMTPLTT